MHMIPLTLHSHYSLMWGTASIRQLCRRARQLGYQRLALTDTDNLYGLWSFLTTCRREGLTPIVGADVTDPRNKCRAVCLVKNAVGYANLCQLITRRHTDEAFELATTLPSLGEGLVVLVRNPHLLATWHNAGVQVAAALPRKPLSADHSLRQTARKLGVTCVATPGVFFLDPTDVKLHHMLRAIDRNCALSRLRANDVAPADSWLAPPQTYARRFALCPETIRATQVLADHLTFTGPRFGLVIPPVHHPDHQNAAEHLRQEAYEGARKRYGNDLSEAVVKRLEHELRIITQMGFGDYFLIVRDIVTLSPRTCGRGSGAASLVAYVLGITNVCPIKHNLYFERFLNAGRKDPPDIDVDFAWDERDKVLATVLENQKGHAAMVSSHILFQPRMAIREVARVFGLSEGEIGRVTGKLPSFWRTGKTIMDLQAALKAHPRSRHLTFTHPWPQILAMAHRLLGTPRYLSVHPGGIVLTPGPIATYVPVEQAPKGVPVIQWEKEGAEAAGLVKIDLLGNRSLGVIRDAIANIRINKKEFDEDHWEPEDDSATQEALAFGRTMGCFYIESPAMRLLQQKAGVGDFEHLVIHSSIIRPAANEYIQEYLRRFHGGSWTPIHPLLADVLADTFGIMVYQEDIARAVTALAGFSPAEADGLRKILSKKDREYELQDFYDRFTKRARLKGVPQTVVTQVWQMIMSFSGYSFCKPHSASYARVSYQAAYLKIHHPAEFMAAVISNGGGFYDPFAYVSEARRMGLRILPPDVTISEARWSGHQDCVRVGLSAIKGLSAETQGRILDQRRQATFVHINDFWERVHPTEEEARALIFSGALDLFAPATGRVALMWSMARWQHACKRNSVNATLFSDPPDTSGPPLPAESQHARLRREFSVLGFLCACHPMTLYKDHLQQFDITYAVNLSAQAGRRVQMAGWLITGKQVYTRHGDPMQFITFEDETGIVETTFFPGAYRRFCHLIDRGRPYLLSGRVEQNWGVTTLTVGKVTPLPKVTSPPALLHTRNEQHVDPPLARISR